MSLLLAFLFADLITKVDQIPSMEQIQVLEPIPVIHMIPTIMISILTYPQWSMGDSDTDS